jgi:hypothetical protein
MALQALWTFAVFQFLSLYTVGRTPWTGDQPVSRPLPTHRTTQTQNKRIQTSVPRVGFEPTIPAFERVETVHALDSATTVIGFLLGLNAIIQAIPNVLIKYRPTNCVENLYVRTTASSINTTDVQC